MTGAAGYIYITGWEDFQHPDVKRRATPGAAWIKCYVDLLDNPSYADLPPTARALLHALWILTARMGQGRCTASAQHIQRMSNFPAGHVHRNLERLIHAGFIEVRASRAQAVRKQTASPEVEGSKEPQIREVDAVARDSATGVAATAQNGDNPNDEDQPLSPDDQAAQLARLRDILPPFPTP